MTWILDFVTGWKWGSKLILRTLWRPDISPKCNRIWVRVVNRRFAPWDGEEIHWHRSRTWHASCNKPPFWYDIDWAFFSKLLTPWCRVLLEKLTGLQLIKKFPAFYGTRRFITALTSVRHLSLSWASPIQSTYPHPTSWRSILILSSHLRLGLPNGLYPSLQRLVPINAIHYTDWAKIKVHLP